MKSVIRSAKPYWIYLILMGKKTVEVGKDFPKSADWNKIVEMYCSKDMRSFNRIPEKDRVWMSKYLGKIACRFTCDRIEKFVVGSLACDDVEEKACLSYKEICDYFYGDNYDNTVRIGYAWHISDLKIYDKPKELWKFKSFLSDKDIRCKYISKPYNPYGKKVVHCTLQKCYCEFHNLASQTDCCGYEPLKEIRPLTRPFQSWGYIEE